MTEKSLAEKYKIESPKQLDPSLPVLVVEHQQDLRLIVVHHLNKLNFKTIIQNSDGLEALETIKQMGPTNGPCVIICDMDMPQLSGLEVLNELQENPEIARPPFCLAMDEVNKEKVMLAVESGVDEVLVKPFTLNDILPKMKAGFMIFHNVNNPEKLYELAKQFYREQKLDEAAKVYQDLMAHASRAARPMVGMARIHFAKGEDDKALALLKEAEAKNPHFVHLYGLRAEVFAKQNNWEQAINCLGEAIRISPLNPIRYKSAADMLFKVNRYKDAADLLEIALKHNVQFKGLHHYLSQAHFAMRDFQVALKHIRSALSTEPENVVYLNQLGICHKEMNDFEEATKIYNRIIKLDPENEAALYNKAIMFNTKGQTDEAIRILERLVKKKPDFEPARLKLAEYQQQRQGGAA